MDIVIFCLKDAATDWLLWGGIILILLAWTIRGLRGWKASGREMFRSLTPHIIICAGLVTVFSILTGIFQSAGCMFICDILDIVDVMYIILVSNFVIFEKRDPLWW